MEPTAELTPLAPPPSDEAGEESSQEENSFEERIARLLELIEAEPATRDRMLAEIYVTIAEFQHSFKEMQSQMEEIGPSAVFRSLFGRKG